MSIFGARSDIPNKLGSIQIQTSEYGVPIPYAAGTVKLPVKLIDYVGFRAVGESQGGKGGGDVSSYEYFATIDCALCTGPIDGIGNAYDEGGASDVTAAVETYTIPAGGGTHTSASNTTENDQGVTYQQAYNFTANDYGSDGEQTFSGTHQVPMEKVQASPGAGEYSVVQDSNVTSTSGGIITGSGGNLHYTFSGADAGKTVTITYTYTTQTTNYVSPAAKFNLGILLGEAAGSVWAYMASKYPARALSYPYTARVVAENFDLGSSASPPNVSVEVLNARRLAFGSGIADCDPSRIINDICTHPVVGMNWPYIGDLTAYSNFCVANNLFQSIGIDSQRKALDVLKEIIDLSNAEAVWSGGTLKVVPYGDSTAIANGRTFSPATTPVYELDYSDIINDKGGEPLLVSWPGLADNYNSLQFQYTRRDDNYNNDVLNDKDEASILMNGLLPMKTIVGDNYREKDYAAVAMNMLLKRNAVALRQYTFKLKWWYQLLEPMDIVLLKPKKRAVRIVSIQENDDYSLSVVAEDFLYGVGTGVLYPKGDGGGVSSAAHDQPGDTNLLAAFQPSTRLTGGTNELWIAVAGGTAWGGCDLWLSTDNATYQKIGRQYGASRAGTLTASVPAGSDPDITDGIAVVTTGSLSSGTQANADAFATLCLVGEELISYETATLTGSTALTNSYTLGTYLRRGLFSTSAEAHTAGELFVRLDDQITKYVLDASLLGTTLYLKATSFNLFAAEEQSLSAVAARVINLGQVSTASTMIVGSFANNDGTTATVDVYLYNGGVGDSGTGTLANGATVTLPAQTWSAEAPSTWYGVNFNPATNAYVLYTSRSAWLADQTTMLGIGSTTTPAAGATAFQPTRNSDLGSSATDNPAGAYTAGQSSTVTSSSVRTSDGSPPGGFQDLDDGDSSSDQTYNGLCAWYGFSGVASAAMTLSVTAALTVTHRGTAGSSSNALYCSLDGGSTWTSMFTGSTTTASSTYTATIPSGQNLANVQIQAASSSVLTGTGTSGNSSASFVISNIAIA